MGLEDNKLSVEWTVKLAIISCEYAFSWTVGYLDHFATASKSALVVVRKRERESDAN